MSLTDGSAVWDKILEFLNLRTLAAARTASPLQRKRVNNCRIASRHTIKPTCERQLTSFLSPMRMFPLVALDLSAPRFCRKWVCDEAIMIIATASPTLRTLDLSNCNVTDAGVKAVATACASLEQFSVGGQVTHVGIGRIVQACGKLRALGLGSNMNWVRDPSQTLQVVAGCSTLEEVSVGFSLDDSHVRILARSQARLKSVSLRGTQLTDAPACDFIKAQPRLQKCQLGLGYCLTDAILEVMGKGLPLLREVDLKDGKITDAGVVALTLGCPSLLRLGFVACKKLTDAAAIAVGKNCRKLLLVKFPYVEALTDVGVCALAEGCPLLEDVCFSWCPLLTPLSVHSLETHCPRLEKVLMLNCPAINPGVYWEKYRPP